MKKVIIFRDDMKDERSIGVCFIQDENKVNTYIGRSLELGWKNNAKKISCIPFGTYDLVYEYSKKFKRFLWEVKGVDNRAECKFHSFNYAKQSNGCIALGNKLRDINKDGVMDVTSSVSTLAKFHKELKGEKRAILIIDPALQ